jgi:hypothetical protein
MARYPLGSIHSLAYDTNDIKSVEGIRLTVAGFPLTAQVVVRRPATRVTQTPANDEAKPDSFSTPVPLMQKLLDQYGAIW